MKTGAPKRQAEALKTPEGNCDVPKQALSRFTEALAKKDLSKTYLYPLVPEKKMQIGFTDIKNGSIDSYHELQFHLFALRLIPKYGKGPC